MSGTVRDRQKQYVYGLWYPAALGTFAYTGLSGNPTDPWTAMPWQLPLIVYFSFQFLEGTMEASERYPFVAMARDFIEILAMAMTFHLLYPDSIKLLGIVSGNPLIAVAATLVIPPLYRIAFERDDRLRGVHRRSYWILTGLSLGVAVTVLAAAGKLLPERAAFWTMVVVLSGYGVWFVFGPGRDRGDSGGHPAAGAAQPEVRV